MDINLVFYQPMNKSQIVQKSKGLEGFISEFFNIGIQCNLIPLAIHGPI